MTLDEEYMTQALERARRAAELGEIPVGAIVVDPDGICVNLFEERFTHIPFVRSRILMEQCGGVLTEFFRELRMSQDDE